ncbi:metal-dependent hydrolase [Halostagnicola larsenii XH-48]|uniref:Metal-dependent hydrolase n=1 Tax=Halostagnicola larsenii XH-48 TaxID=797299 RepID=W0JRJ3_9EURY|nr:metal-dependent hydrolase [Halostagnicola larsenii]AHF99901.1 metal-dependent hydrolase [Halostagnicola larsenii XH-48]
MYRFGHFGVALLAYAPLGVGVALAGAEGLAVVGGLVCVSLSTFPDCDHDVPFLEHRGITHTLGFAVLVGVVLAAAASVLLTGTLSSSVSLIVPFAFVVGTLSILSHLLADAITPMGIRPFRPVSSYHYTAELTPAANPVANYALFAIGVVVTAASVWLVAVLS